MSEFNSSGKKVCSKCGLIKDISEFHRNKTHKDGYHSICKDCTREYYEANKEQIIKKSKEYYETNKEQIIKKSKEYYETNKDRIADYRLRNKERKKNYRLKNKERIAEKQKEYYKENKDKIAEYRQENKDKIAEQHKKYYEANKELIDEKKKEYRQANKEKIAEKVKEYRQTERGKMVYKLKNQKRRARKRALPNTLTLEEWNQTLNDFNHSCANCGKKGKLHMDHFFPLAMEYRGTTASNCIPLCATCNLSKGSKNPEDFFSKDKLIAIAKYLISRKNYKRK